MTVQLSSLRVSADLDASKYLAGAAQKVAADKSMTAAAREAGSAISSIGTQAQTTDTRLSRAADGVERLKRQFVTGYAAAADFERNIKVVGTGLERGKITTEQAATAIENLSRKYGQAIDPQSKLIQGSDSLSQASRLAMESISLQATAVDDLTASYARMAQEARAAQAAEQSRTKFDAFLGVGRPAGTSASSSASVFESEFARQSQLEQIAQMKSAQNASYFGADLNRRMGIGSQGSDARASAAVFETAAREAESYAQKAAMLRAQLDPVAAMQARINAEIAEFSVLAQRGEISALEFAQAQAMAQKRMADVGKVGGSGGRNFAATNAMFQFQDIGMTAAMGMDPRMIGLQQGTQLAGAYAGLSMKEAAATTGAALAGLVSPVSIAAIGFTALAAAAIQYGVSVVGSINTSANALEKHEEALKRIKALYDTAAESGEQFGQRTQSAITFTANQDRQALQKALADGLKNFAYRASPTPDASQYQFPGADMAGLEQQQLRDNFGPFASTVSRFLDQAREGKGDVLELNKQIQELANSDPANKAMQRIATTILGYTDQATKAAEAVKELNKQQLELTMTMARTEAAASARKYEADNTYQRFAMTRQYDAEVAGIGARSPQQIADATRRRLEAEPVDPGKESVETRALRIQQQVDLAYRQANQSVIEAQQSRAQSLDKMLTDQQMEIDLLGKTGGAAIALRKEYELTSQLRLEAARQGIEVDQRELDMIKERAAALGQLTDLYNQRRFNTDMAQQGADADMLGRDRQIVQTLRQYGLPEDLGGGNASIIRDSLNREASRTAISGFMTDFRSNLLRNGGDLGDALGDTIKNALLNSLSKASEQAIERLTNTIVGALFGQRPAGGGIVSSVANDNVAGGFSGLAKVIPVTRAPLGDISSYAAAIKKIESSGNYSAMGPITRNGDRAYGGYQVMGNNIGPWSKEALGRSISSSEFLANPDLQDQIFNHKFGSYVDKFGPSGAAQAWFGGPGSVGKGGNGADILGTTGNSYVARFNDALGSASGNLNTFGGGLDKMGTGLTNVGSSLASGGASAAAGGGGGGGLFGWLGGLFGGGGTSQWNLAKSGAITGLFADGTGSAPGGLAVVGERGREIVNLPRGSQVIPNHRTESMMAANRNGGAAGSGGRLDIGVSVDDEGALRAYVKRESSSAARSETASAFSAYGDSQRRGQFGEMQRRYSNQKG